MTLIRSLLPLLFLAPAVVLGAPGDVTLAKPTAVCPEAQLGDDHCQSSYDEMWKAFQAKLTEQDRALTKTLADLYDEAKSAGNLDLVLFWDGMQKSFANTGKVVWEPSAQKKAWKKFGDAEFPTGLSNDLRKCMDGYEDAKTALEDGYKKLVVELTKAGKVDEALAIKKEAAGLWATASRPAPTPGKPSQKTEPTVPKGGPAQPKDGKYRFAYNDGTGWGMLLEKRGDVLWVSGDINPQKPGGVFVWPKPRPVSFEIKGQKIICDDRRPEYKWAFVFTWDLVSGEATRQMDVADPSSVKRGTVRPGTW